MNLIRRWAVVAAGVWSLAQAMAAPADDYQRGLAAYQRGDVVTAMKALRPAASAGHPGAQSLLGSIMDRSDFTADALKLWQQAAAQGDPEALAGLGNYYLTGRALAKDEKQAQLHFSKAAAAGHAASIQLMATAWVKGQMGLDAKAEPAAALAAVRRAADAGHLASADAMAVAYRDGLYGLAPDAAQANTWLSRAAGWRAQRAATPPRAASGPAK